MTFLVLPKLKNDSDVRPSDKIGRWDAQSPKAFQDVAFSLDYKSPGRIKSVSSVPTMWARPMSMEMALHNKGLPRNKMTNYNNDNHSKGGRRSSRRLLLLPPYS